MAERTGVRLAEKSRAACALTGWGDRLHLAWAGTDLRLNLASSADGQVLADKQPLPYRSYHYDTSSSDDSFADLVVAPPSVACTHDRLFLAWTDQTAALTLLVAGARGFSPPVVLAQRSYHSPALSVSADGDPVLAWTGTDRRVNLLVLGRGPGAPPTRFEAARSGTGPALCAHAGTHVLAWTGTDRRVNLLTLSGRSAGHRRLDEARTYVAPALCSHRGSLVLAWTGTDRHVNLLTVGERTAHRPVRLDGARTGHAPALCGHRDDLVLGWVGNDARLNLARFPA